MKELCLLSTDDVKAMIGTAATTAAEEVIRRLPIHPRPLHVNQRQAAEMLGVSKPTVGKLVKTGALKLNR